MLSFFSLFAFLSALIGSLITLIMAIKKTKNPNIKMKWIILPALLSILSLLTNRYVNGEISDLAKKELSDLKNNLNDTKGELKYTRSSIDSLISNQDSLIFEFHRIKFDLNKIDTRTKQRQISKKYINSIIDELKKRKGEKIQVTHITEDLETKILADEIADLFEECGWVVLMSGAGQMNPSPIGIRVNVADKKFATKASFILTLLNMAGLKPNSAGSTLPQYIKGEVEIFIGSNPEIIN